MSCSNASAACTRVAGRAAALAARDHVEGLELALEQRAACDALADPGRQIAVHQAPGERRDHADRLDAGEVLAAAQAAGDRALAAVRVGRLAVAQRPLVGPPNGRLGILEAVRTRPPPQAALLIGFARREQHAIGDLVDDAREALVRCLTADVEALADLLPGRRRGPRGGDRSTSSAGGRAVARPRRARRRGDTRRRTSRPDRARRR
jgi:hypothetical protein